MEVAALLIPERNAALFLTDDHQVAHWVLEQVTLLGMVWEVVVAADEATLLLAQDRFNVLIGFHGSTPGGFQTLQRLTAVCPEIATIWVDPTESTSEASLTVRALCDVEAVNRAVLKATSEHRRRVRIGQGRHALLVEDDPADALITSRMLARSGWHVCFVESLEEALASLRSRRFDVILTDLTLPDAYEIEAVASLCKNAPTTPVVVLSGFDDLHLEQLTVSQGAQDHLVKSELDERRLNRALLHAMERKRAEQRLSGLANTDPLTGLPNRRSFVGTLRRPQSHGGALLLVDLDCFKTINDTLGHNGGDYVLREVAQRLQRFVRHDDVVGRLGGDEFGIFLHGPLSNEQLEDVVARLRSHVLEEVEVSGRVVSPSVSIGIAHIDTADPAEVMRRADLAMYSVKAHGRDGVAFWGSHGASAAGFSLQEVMRALSNGEMRFHYQAQHELPSDEIIGFEALLRWKHPEHGLLLPGVFLPLLEGTPAMTDLARVSLRWGLNDLKALRELTGGRQRLAFNLGAAQLSDPCLVDTVRVELARAGLAGDALEIELLETSLVRETTHVIRTLQSLRALGIRIAIDDFGAGYSSLGYLGTLPVDVLKLDRTLVTRVTEPAGKIVLGGLVDLGHRLGLTVLAECVETDAQLALVRSLGVDLAQGHVLGHPMAVEEWTRLLQHVEAEAG